MIQDVVVADLPKTPVPGRDYPRTWDEFHDWFTDEGACRDYLEDIRWRGGFQCPSCGETGEALRSSRGRWICRHCHFQCTVTAGIVTSNAP